MSERERSVLILAAERAGASTSVSRAVSVAWSTLHSDGVETMVAAFRRWADHEDVRRIPDLGGVLRRRYSHPTQVAASLIAAAALLDPEDGER